MHFESGNVLCRCAYHEWQMPEGNWSLVTQRLDDSKGAAAATRGLRVLRPEPGDSHETVRRDVPPVALACITDTPCGH